MALLAPGLPLDEAAGLVGVDRRTLARWQAVGHAPWRHRRPGGSIRRHLGRRWSEGCGNARQLRRELVAQGLTGQLLLPA